MKILTFVFILKNAKFSILVIRLLTSSNYLLNCLFRRREGTDSKASSEVSSEAGGAGMGLTRKEERRLRYLTDPPRPWLSPHFNK